MLAVVFFLLHLHLIRKSFAFGIRSHLCSDAIGKMVTKHSVRSTHHGNQPRRPGSHEEEGQVPETEGPDGVMIGPEQFCFLQPPGGARIALGVPDVGECAHPCSRRRAVHAT